MTNAAQKQKKRNGLKALKLKRGNKTSGRFTTATNTQTHKRTTPPTHKHDAPPQTKPYTGSGKAEPTIQAAPRHDWIHGTPQENGQRNDPPGAQYSRQLPRLEKPGKVERTITAMAEA